MAPVFPQAISRLKMVHQGAGVIQYDNASTLRRFVVALINRKLDMAGSLVTPDVSYRIAGRSPIAGEFHGRDEALAGIQRMVDLTAGTLTPEVHDIFADDEHGVVMNRVRAERGERRIEYSMVHLFHFREGRICDIHSIPLDQYAFDEFYS